MKLVYLRVRVEETNIHINLLHGQGAGNGTAQYGELLRSSRGWLLINRGYQREEATDK